MKIQGVLPVIQLPYHEDYSIDADTLQKEIDWVFAAGVDGITLAMVSEITRLSDHERDQLVHHVVNFVAGRGPVIASVGDESIQQAIRHAQAAADRGASAIMAIPPCLTRCGEDELKRYYTALVEATPLPVIIQDPSGYLGNPVPLSVQIFLYRQYSDKIMFKPEALPVGPLISALQEATSGNAAIFEGRGGITLMDTYPRGITGIMLGADIPWATVVLWRALQQGDITLAGRIHAPNAALVSLMHNLDAYLVIMKTLLVKQGIFKNTLVRGPVGFTLDQEMKNEVFRIFESLKHVVENV